VRSTMSPRSTSINLKLLHQSGDIRYRHLINANKRGVALLVDSPVSTSVSPNQAMHV
jgi:hypothetical protein